jgi:hypothetical protein
MVTSKLEGSVCMLFNRSRKCVVSFTYDFVICTNGRIMRSTRAEMHLVGHSLANMIGLGCGVGDFDFCVSLVKDRIVMYVDAEYLSILLCPL